MRAQDYYSSVKEQRDSRSDGAKSRQQRSPFHPSDGLRQAPLLSAASFWPQLRNLFAVQLLQAWKRPR